MREREIEKRLCERVKALGGVTYKWVSPGNAGVPDRILILPHLPVIFVELKTDTGKLTPLQKTQHKRLLSRGVKVYTLYGEIEVDQFLEGLRVTLDKFKI